MAGEFLIQAFGNALRIQRWREKFVFAFFHHGPGQWLILEEAFINQIYWRWGEFVLTNFSAMLLDGLCFPLNFSRQVSNGASDRVSKAFSVDLRIR